MNIRGYKEWSAVSHGTKQNRDQYLSFRGTDSTSTVLPRPKAKALGIPNPETSTASTLIPFLGCEGGLGTGQLSRGVNVGLSPTI